MLDAMSLSLLDRAVEGVLPVDVESARAQVRSGASFCSTVWRAVIENGWLGVLASEDVGGSDTGIAAAASVARRLGYTSRPEPYIECTSAAICCQSAPAIASSIVAGRLDATIAWPVRSGAIDMARPGISFNRRGTALTLSGEICFVSPADAKLFIVGARSHDTLALCVLERDARGLSISRREWADGTFCASLSFEGVDVQANQIVAQGPDVERILGEAFDAALILQSAHLLGLVDRTLEITLDYLRIRRQFGKPIGSFQALRHRAVDLWVLKQLTDGAVGEAVRIFQDAAPNLRGAAASGAKYRAAKTAIAVTTEAVQFHGAIGFTEQYELSLHLNRAVKFAAWLGDSSAHRTRYAALSPTLI